MRSFGISPNELAEGSASLRQCLSRVSSDRSRPLSPGDEDRAIRSGDTATNRHSCVEPKHARSSKASMPQRSFSSPGDVLRDTTGLLVTLEKKRPLYEQRASSVELRVVDDKQEGYYPLESCVSEKDSPPGNTESASILNGVDVYKGEWINDRREGYGVCYYGDGGRYIGEWRDNKRHGYGLMVSREGHQSGGKWYNDVLLFMTQRRSVDLRLPVVKNRMRRSVVRGMESVELANSKSRLAVARGLSARKIAVLGKQAGRAADLCADDAIACAEDYTIHPYIAAGASNGVPETSPSHISPAGSLSKRSPISLYSDPSSPVVSRKWSAPDRPKKTRSLKPLRHSFNLGVREYVAKTRRRRKESVWCAAADTILMAGAVDPTTSEYFMIKRSDMCASRSKAVAEKSTLCKFISESGPYLLVSRTGADMADQQVSEREGSGVSSCNSSRRYLHPNDFTDRPCKVVSSSPPLESSGSSHPEPADAEPVVISGKLLNGDEVDFHYRCVNATVKGQETFLLYTDHQRSGLVKKYAISEDGLVVASTGFYRTISGRLPPILTLKSETCIPMLGTNTAAVDAVAPEEYAGVGQLSISPVSAPMSISAASIDPALEQCQLLESNQDGAVLVDSLGREAEEHLAVATLEYLTCASTNCTRSSGATICASDGEPSAEQTVVHLQRTWSDGKPRSRTVLVCSSPERTGHKQKPFSGRRRHTVNVLPRPSVKQVSVRCEIDNSSAEARRNIFLSQICADGDKSDANPELKTRDTARDVIITAEENFMRESHERNSSASLAALKSSDCDERDMFSADEKSASKKGFFRHFARLGGGKLPNNESLSVDSGFKQSISVDSSSVRPSSILSNDESKGALSEKFSKKASERSLESITSYEHVKFSIDQEARGIGFSRFKTLLKKAFRSSSAESTICTRDRSDSVACSLTSVQGGSNWWRKRKVSAPSSGAYPVCSAQTPGLGRDQGEWKVCGGERVDNSCSSLGMKPLETNGAKLEYEAGRQATWV